MIDVLIVLAVILLLVLVNGLFVAAEFAIVGAPRATIENRADHGDRAARRVQRILEDPRRQDRFIATAQIGISLASLGLGMYGEHQLAVWLEPWLATWAANPWITSHIIASVVAVAFLTYLHIVLGEMVPKALALQHAASTAIWVSPLILAVQRPLTPVVHALNNVGTWVLSMVGIERREVSAERYHTTEELQYIIEESQEGGLLRGESGDILQELFEFGDLSAGEVMVPRVLIVGIPVGAEPDEVRAIVGSHPHTRYPIFSGGLDNIIGSIHIKEVLRHLVSSRAVTARDARPLPYVPGPAPLDQVLPAMRRYRAQMAVVMDQHGGTAGLVTMEDLFEEVVGEIEEGRRPTPIMRDAQGRLRVRGTVRLTEVGETLERELDHPKTTTVSGLVLLLLGRPAQVGDVVVYKNVRFEVTAVAGRGVLDAVVTPIAPPAPPPGTE
jgi:magnesium and cobalt exporter, CNNM family